MGACLGLLLSLLLSFSPFFFYMSLLIFLRRVKLKVTISPLTVTHSEKEKNTLCFLSDSYWLWRLLEDC